LRRRNESRLCAHGLRQRSGCAGDLTHGVPPKNDGWRGPSCRPAATDCKPQLPWRRHRAMASQASSLLLLLLPAANNQRHRQKNKKIIKIRNGNSWVYGVCVCVLGWRHGSAGRRAPGPGLSCPASPFHLLWHRKWHAAPFALSSCGGPLLLARAARALVLGPCCSGRWRRHVFRRPVRQRARWALTGPLARHPRAGRKSLCKCANTRWPSFFPLIALFMYLGFLSRPSNGGDQSHQTKGGGPAGHSTTDVERARLSR
jgi:hypothetical protein